MILPIFDNVAVGEPLTRLNLSFFPVYLPGNELPEVVSGKNSGLTVEELEHASVNTLEANNPTDKLGLFIEGEHHLGGRQNRAINVTVLLKPKSKAKIPVSCLEQGRWGRRQKWQRNESFAPERVRAEKRKGVTETMRTGSRRGNQGKVWDEIHSMLHSENLSSDTMAASKMNSTYEGETSRAKAVNELVSKGALPNQCGIVVAKGDRIIAMDLFGSPQLLSDNWNQLVRSYPVGDESKANPPPTDSVLSLIQRFGRANAEEHPGVGVGTEFRIRDGKLNGQVLALDGAIAHASFSVDE